MKVAFRVDSSYSIGSGHIHRCLNLADSLNAEVVFICRELNGNLNDLPATRGHKLFGMPDIQDYAVQSPIEETEELKSLFQEIKPDLIVVDHYGLDFKWEIMAKTFAKVLAIDDLGRHHEADAVLDQNFKLDLSALYQSSPSRLFLGPEYAILSSAFRKVSPISVIEPLANEILVFFGGADPSSMTMKSLEMTRSLTPAINWNIVVGSQNKDVESIKRRAEALSNVKIHINVGYMADLIRKSQLFIGAGGTNTWERTKLGLPSLVISVAQNQESIAENLSARNIIEYMGRSQDVSLDSLQERLMILRSDPEMRKELHTNSLKLKTGDCLNSLISFLLSGDSP